MAEKKKPINYTSRDFNSIKQDLVNYVKRYYPDTFKDFNEASFGSLMLDTVSYVGDILSFYLDYQTNESFLDSATEYSNVLRLARQLGYKHKTVFASTGEISLYALIPAGGIHGVNSGYYPIIQQGTTFSSKGGSNFMLAADVRFDDPSNEIVVGRVDPTTGEPTYYAVRARGKIISGELFQTVITLGSFERFRKIQIPDTDVVEVISVFDSDGNEYYEVDNLSQNIIYQSITNKTTSTDYKETLRPIVAPRRFTLEFDGVSYFLQFGYGSEDEILENPVADPSAVVLQQVGRTYITDSSFDPSRLLDTDQLGVSPSNTSITITYRKNTAEDVNTPARTVTSINNLLVSFADTTSLDAAELRFVMGSLEVNNEEPISGDAETRTAQEIKIRAVANLATQNRAVTAKDYETISYGMAAKFGSIKRCKIIVDNDSFKRNLNLYVLSEASGGKLIETSTSIKENLRTWLANYKMINDTVDILDGKIVNLGIYFDVIAEKSSNSADVYAACIQRLKDKLINPLQMGEPFYLTNVYSELNKVRGVIDTRDVVITNLIAGAYSSTGFDILSNLSADGRYLSCPDNVVFEIKFPNVDIRGTVR